MNIKSNDPIWKEVYSQSKLPASLEVLKEMSTNLRWVWNHEGAKLFGKIDHQATRCNCSRASLSNVSKKSWLMRN